MRRLLWRPFGDDLAIWNAIDEVVTHATAATEAENTMKDVGMAQDVRDQSPIYPHRLHLQRRPSGRRHMREVGLGKANKALLGAQKAERCIMGRLTATS